MSAIPDVTLEAACAAALDAFAADGHRVAVVLLVAAPSDDGQGLLLSQIGNGTEEQVFALVEFARRHNCARLTNPN